MELTYDWKAFQNAFHLDYKNKGTLNAVPAPIYFVAEDGIIQEFFCENEDFSEWLGRTCDEVSAHFKNREIIVFDRNEVDQWMKDSIPQNHYHAQMNYLKEQALPSVVTPSPFLPGSKRSKKSRHELVHQLSKTHFLLEALHSWWNRILPSSFGIWIRILDQDQYQDLLVVIRRGQVQSYMKPSLLGLGPGKEHHFDQIAQYLSERHALPVQGLVVNRDQWEDWSMQTDPWKWVAQALRAGTLGLHPFRWGVATLIANKAYLGF
ncbi:MAG: hypothetical protein CL678_13630 [Bdellovibrionaceae bacterium]|nr:hypothetical protein [Pseudobdellovibrionaceae bacterium]|tara:strand:- start:1297 stop:2088 length:792 start_codon:yes stop_codon:yes gene_type:complete